MREFTGSSALQILRTYQLNYVFGVCKGKVNPASKQTAVDLGVFCWLTFLQLPCISGAFISLSLHPSYLQFVSNFTLFSRLPRFTASHCSRKSRKKLVSVDEKTYVRRCTLVSQAWAFSGLCYYPLQACKGCSILLHNSRIDVNTLMLMCIHYLCSSLLLQGRWKVH